MTITTEVSMASFVDIASLEEATWAYLHALSEDELRQNLYPHVRDRMRDLRRRLDMAREDAAFGSRSPKGQAVDLLSLRMDLIGMTFALRDGTRVAWDQATAEQHRERAEMQRALAGKAVMDAERHEWAAAEIEKHNASCLAEITP